MFGMRQFAARARQFGDAVVCLTADAPASDVRYLFLHRSHFGMADLIRKDHASCMSTRRGTGCQPGSEAHLREKSKPRHNTYPTCRRRIMGFQRVVLLFRNAHLVYECGDFRVLYRCSSFWPLALKIAVDQVWIVDQDESISLPLCLPSFLVKTETCEIIVEVKRRQTHHY